MENTVEVNGVEVPYIKVDKDEWDRLKSHIKRTECRLRDIDGLISAEPHSFVRAGTIIGRAIECMSNLTHQLEQIEEFDQ